jgi:hypothetical protein
MKGGRVSIKEEMSPLQGQTIDALLVITPLPCFFSGGVELCRDM